MNKDFFTFRALKTSTMLMLALSTFTLFSSCKSDEEDPNKSATVQFKVQASSGVQIKAIVSQVGTQQSSNFTVPGSSWQSEPKVVDTSIGAVHLSSTADGMDPESTLIVSIFVNGEKKASDTAKGLDLTATTMVDFIK